MPYTFTLTDAEMEAFMQATYAVPGPLTEGQGILAVRDKLGSVDRYDDENEQDGAEQDEDEGPKEKEVDEDEPNESLNWPKAGHPYHRRNDEAEQEKKREQNNKEAEAK